VKCGFLVAALRRAAELNNISADLCIPATEAQGRKAPIYGSWRSIYREESPNRPAIPVFWLARFEFSTRTRRVGAPARIGFVTRLLTAGGFRSAMTNVIARAQIKSSAGARKTVIPRIRQQFRRFGPATVAAAILSA